MRKPKRDYWTERGFENRKDWCKHRNKEYFEKKSKLCKCGVKFLGNRNFCSMKCTIIEKIKISENGCWEWQGCCDSHGYGLIKDYENGKNVRVHRASFEIFKHKIPNKLFICHECDNPKCCNPEHLWLGNHKSNMHDAISKGRFIYIEKKTGENSARAKLTNNEVKEIFVRISKGEKLKDLAIEYGVHVNTIYSIKFKRNWKSIL